jgi:hypothetical protein
MRKKKPARKIISSRGPGGYNNLVFVVVVAVGAHHERRLEGGAVAGRGATVMLTTACAEHRKRHRRRHRSNVPESIDWISQREIFFSRASAGGVRLAGSVIRRVGADGEYIEIAGRGTVPRVFDCYLNCVGLVKGCGGRGKRDRQTGRANKLLAFPLGFLRVLCGSSCCSSRVLPRKSAVRVFSAPPCFRGERPTLLQ